MPARFLTDEQLATYGRYAADPPDQAVLERFFFLDDADRDLVATRRGDHGPSRKATAEIIARFAATGRDDPDDRSPARHHRRGHPISGIRANTQSKESPLRDRDG